MPGPEDLCRETTLDHYRAPGNRGDLPAPPAHKVEGFNPLCGDEVVLYLDVDDDGVLRDVRTGGQGGSISQAATAVVSGAGEGPALPHTPPPIPGVTELGFEPAAQPSWDAAVGVRA